MSRNLRVAYFAGTMKPGQDGVTRVLYYLIDAIEKTGIKSIFFSPIIPQDGQKVKMVKVPSVTIPLNREYKFAVPGSRYFEEKLKIFNPDLIHINSPCPLGHAAVIYANKNSIPVVSTYHTHFPSFAKYYNLKVFEMFSWSYLRSLYNKCDSVFVPSTPVFKELKQHGFETIEFLPHGVDSQIFNPSFKDDEWKRRIGAEGKTVVLYVGRLAKEKDLQSLLQCYNIVSEKREDLKFVLVGDGPVKQKLKDLMPEAIFLGYQSGKDLSTSYASSDIFILPSTTETFGNVTLEAMASKVPPICVREGGASGLINDGITGLIAEPRNAKDLAEKLLFLTDNTEAREKISEQAYKFSQKQSWEKIFQRLFNRYEEINLNYFSSIKAA